MWTWEVETGVFELPSAKPLMVMVAGDFWESCLILVQVSVSGRQARRAACSGLRLMGGPASGSILPSCR